MIENKKDPNLKSITIHKIYNNLTINSLIFKNPQIHFLESAFSKPLFFLLTCLYFCISIQGYSQGPYPKNYFSSPIPDSLLQLAGNFGEIRPNHFHAGLDIRTANQEGMKILAVADGYVSRIKISATGYGKCLYITHPNGFVSVYGHLKSYNDSIGKFAKAAQYALELFEIEVFPKENELPVKKGQLVALSGNTGGSSGPHLHFEMRDEKTESAINPLLFGYNVKDNIKPVIKALYLYQFDLQTQKEKKQNI